MHRRYRLLVALLAVVLGVTTSCTPIFPSPYQLGPGSLSWVLDDGTTEVPGGGDVDWVFSSSRLGPLFAGGFCPEEPTSRWGGVGTTRPGFDGLAGEWDVVIDISTGQYGYCGDAIVRITDPDGDVQVDGMAMRPVYISDVGCGDTFGVMLVGAAPLVGEPSVTARVEIVVCNSAVASSFSQGF